MTTTLPEKHKQELKAHQDSQSKDRLYQATKADSNKPVKLPVGIEVNELRMKHNNFMLDQENKKTREVFKKFIKEGKDWTLEQFNLELKKAMKDFKQN